MIMIGFLLSFSPGYTQGDFYVFVNPVLQFDLSSMICKHIRHTVYSVCIVHVFFFSLGRNSKNSFVLLPCQNFSELSITLKPGLCVLSPHMPPMLVILLLQSQCTSISKVKIKVKQNTAPLTRKAAVTENQKQISRQADACEMK